MPEKRPRNLGSDPKQFVVGRALSQSAHSEMDDMVALPRLLFRLVTLPIWLPYRGWKSIQRRRQKAEFAMARAQNVFVNDDVVRKITLEWVENHPADYPLGEYDPKVRKLQRSFKKILDRHE